MEIHTSLSVDKVLTLFQRGWLGTYALGTPVPKAGNRWGSTWERRVIAIRPLDDEDRKDLHDRFQLPATFNTCIWITTPDMYRDEQAVHHMMATALREWEGDLALFNGGDDLEVKRVDGNVQVQTDYLSAGSLAAYQGEKWRPFPQGVVD